MLLDRVSLLTTDTSTHLLDKNFGGAFIEADLELKREIERLLDELRADPLATSAEAFGDLRTLFEHGVHASDVIVLLATKGVLTRPWCLLEVYEAARLGVPILTRAVEGRG